MSRAKNPEFQQQFSARVQAAMEAGGLDRYGLALRMAVLAAKASGQAPSGDGADLSLLRAANAREKAIRGWVGGRTTPSADQMGFLADALGVTVDYLLGRSDDVGLSATIRDVSAVVEKLPETAGSRSSQSADQSPTQVRPRRARRPKSA